MAAISLSLHSSCNDIALNEKIHHLSVKFISIAEFFTFFFLHVVHPASL